MSKYRVLSVKQQRVKSAGRGDCPEVVQVNEADPRVKRTRKLLLDAFGTLLMEKGFHAISVQDIAARATVNRATFYAHFVDKYALLDQMISEWFREVLGRRHLAATPFSLSNLHRLIVTVLEALAEFHGHCKPLDRQLDPLIEARVQQELNEFLRGWLGPLPLVEAHPRVTRETIATVLSWAIFGAGIAWSRGPHDLPVDDRARQILTLLTGGLAQVVNLPGLARHESNGAIVREALGPKSG
jgi:AcrR family transcriptional regulator